MPRETWARFYTGEITIEDVLNAKGTSFEGNQTEIIEFFNMFDRFDPVKHEVVPAAPEEVLEGLGGMQGK